MPELTHEIIKSQIAESEVIFSRGENLFLLGNYTLTDSDEEAGTYSYTFDGNYGDYEVSVVVKDDGEEDVGEKKGGNGGKPSEFPVSTKCTCPYLRKGCKHVVAACLDIERRMTRKRKVADKIEKDGAPPDKYLTPEEIRETALKSRRERAAREELELFSGETRKGRHAVKTAGGKTYTVTVYQPAEGRGHCDCPDFATNHLETCKHLIFTLHELGNGKKSSDTDESEVFPFIHITWNSRQEKPACYYEEIANPELESEIGELFNEKGLYTRTSINRLYKLYLKSGEDDGIVFDEYLLDRLERILYEREIDKLRKKHAVDFSILKTELYPYQKTGVEFAAFKRASIIADEMGLGKTVQAIGAAQMKKRIFGFSKVLVICPSSVKEQWKREIEKFTDETAFVVAGPRKKRYAQYREEQAFIKITNYEAVLRDILAIREWGPELIVLDEAQRIKNFETKTHKALMSLPREHVIILTGTPLENKLEDVYSIVQFCDPDLLTPLWAFAANHFNLDRKNKVQGYRNLKTVHKKLGGLILRRRRAEVIDSLPDQVPHDYFMPLTDEQEEIHQGYMYSLLAILNKKVITPIDMKRIQMMLLCMRMVCDSTYLIDKQTNISPKLAELVSILNELVVDNGRKVIIFSEWTTMTYLIGKVLSEMGIGFVEFTGKVPVSKRQILVEEFHENPECMVFLSTDAGGVGLNLQNADCVINFELPWNPAKLNQRIGRVARIGQKSAKIDVINLVTKNSIEERVYAAVELKQELFDVVLEGEGGDEVDFSRESKAKFVDQLRKMFDGEPVDVRPEEVPGPELDEDTPHFLNPQALAERETEIDLESEEFGDDEGPVAERDKSSNDGSSGDAEPENRGTSSGSVAPEQLETVLNQGLAFLDSLSRMTTGQALGDPDDTENRKIEIDRDTGEVTLKFKLPGF